MQPISKDPNKVLAEITASIFNLIEEHGGEFEVDPTDTQGLVFFEGFTLGDWSVRPSGVCGRVWVVEEAVPE